MTCYEDTKHAVVLDLSKQCCWVDSVELYAEEMTLTLSALFHEELLDWGVTLIGANCITFSNTNKNFNQFLDGDVFTSLETIF